MTELDRNILKTTATSLEIVSRVYELEGAQLTEIADSLDMNKSTVYKHLKTLDRNGYVVKEGNYYDIGYKFIPFGEYAKSRNRAFELAKQKVDELADHTNEEAALGVEDNGRYLTVHAVYDPNSSFSNRSVGQYHHLHSTAAGKAILAELPKRRVQHIISQWGLPKATDQTIASRKELFDELKTVRDQGYAINDEELREGLRAIGAAVKYPTGYLLGAINISGPSYRLVDSLWHDELPATLLEYRDDLTSEISSPPFL